MDRESHQAKACFQNATDLGARSGVSYSGLLGAHAV
jgi:hypothetical protein